jgi:hypothetical protein
VPHSDHSLIRKRPLAFATITVFGIAALLLGLALVIFAHYHERAYVFLCMGAGGFIGGIAGIVAAGWRVKAALSYGVIGLGMMVGLNYLAVLYSRVPHRTRGEIVIALSIVAILAGIVGRSRPQGEPGWNVTPWASASPTTFTCLLVCRRAWPASLCRGAPLAGFSPPTRSAGEGACVSSAAWCGLRRRLFPRLPMPLVVERAMHIG